MLADLLAKLIAPDDGVQVRGLSAFFRIGVALDAEGVVGEMSILQADSVIMRVLAELTHWNVVQADVIVISCFVIFSGHNEYIA